MPAVDIYLGPSLSKSDAELILKGRYLPPIKRGDLFNTIVERPDLVIIIDGLFFEHAAVAHKEILKVLKAGIKVVGAGSMGALRAFELEPFGMVGIGEVFRRYKEGIIESDDDVALICDPESGAALSEALINIKITLEHAVASGEISKDYADIIEKKATDTYYPDRTWKFILKNLPIRDNIISHFKTWLVLNKVDQKRADALEALYYGVKYLNGN